MPFATRHRDDPHTDAHAKFCLRGHIDVWDAVIHGGPTRA